MLSTLELGLLSASSDPSLYTITSSPDLAIYPFYTPPLSVPEKENTSIATKSHLTGA